jgi:hypothetical protein
MATITLRGLSDEMLETLKKRAQESGLSMNKFIIQKITDSLEEGQKGVHHDLDHLFGTMTTEDSDAICEISQEQRKIDPELW